MTVLPLLRRGLDIAAHAVIRKQTPRIIHPIEGFVDHEAQIGRIFQRHLAHQGAPQLAPVALEGFYGLRAPAPPSGMT
jgi:hypothetical protein